MKVNCKILDQNMSPIEDENRRRRSIALIQLVCDREIDNEIGSEIRSLLEHGVLINFPDQNNKKKTAIHFAVEKGDVRCVKFLLQFRPSASLEVVDDDGQTPIELARSKAQGATPSKFIVFQSILDILLNSTIDVVNESYVEEIDYESLTREKIDAIKSRPTFKVLKLINRPSVKSVLSKINHHAYATTIEESSHLFLITIEMNEMNIDNDPELNLQRPMIVQFSSPISKQSKVYFKDDGMTDFVDITDTPQITQEEFNDAIQSEVERNFKFLVAVLRSNMFGHYTGNLLNTKLNNSFHHFQSGLNTTIARKREVAARELENSELLKIINLGNRLIN